MIRMLFFDLDGTLLMPDHRTISPRTQEALRAARQAGVMLAVATGRCQAILPQAIQSLPFDYLITSNGADVTQVGTGRRILRRHIAPEDAQLAWEILDPYGMFLEWFIDRRIAVDEKVNSLIGQLSLPDWHRDYFSKKAYPVFKSVEDYIQRGAPGLEKLNLLRCDPVKRAEAWEKLERTGRFTLATSLGTNMEVNAQGCSKGSSIEALLQSLHILQEEAAAFGDGGNDVEMLKAVGTGVAMGNALDRVKEQADAITLSNGEEGVAEWIERTLFVREPVSKAGCLMG